jgi:hypothetical protein
MQLWEEVAVAAIVQLLCAIVDTHPFAAKTAFLSRPRGFADPTWPPGIDGCPQLEFEPTERIRRSSLAAGN